MGDEWQAARRSRTLRLGEARSITCRQLCHTARLKPSSSHLWLETVLLVLATLSKNTSPVDVWLGLCSLCNCDSSIKVVSA